MITTVIVNKHQNVNQEIIENELIELKKTSRTTLEELMYLMKNTPGRVVAFVSYYEVNGKRMYYPTEEELIKEITSIRNNLIGQRKVFIVNAELTKEADSDVVSVNEDIYSYVGIRTHKEPATLRDVLATTNHPRKSLETQKLYVVCPIIDISCTDTIEDLNAKYEEFQVARNSTKDELIEELIMLRHRVSDLETELEIAYEQDFDYDY